MINGTNVNEILESLQSGIIVRFIGSGWRPRSRSLEVIIPENEKVFKITSMRDIKRFHELLGDFLDKEAIQAKKDERN
jgi:hypothetical protein